MSVDAAVQDPLARAILDLLAAEAPGTAVSLPRIGKRLGLGASVVMRALSPLGTAAIGGRPGLGWVEVANDGERWLVQLTAAGRAVVAEAGGEGTPPDLV